MSYLELTFFPLHTEDDKSLLLAGLLEAGFDSFHEEESTLLAYISAEFFSEDLMNGIRFLRDHPEIKVQVKQLEDKNWNKEWESNYQPVTIAGKCHVRAPFHPSLPGVDYEIVIEPKMAFGTAHHETTRLMAGWLMKLDVRGKEVLDMGCGTGILAILANKMGAAGVIAIDNDEWAWRNAIDNFRINEVKSEKVYLGDASLIQEESCDIILANINRNVLLQDMKIYYYGLRKQGLLLLSGFYQKDVEAIAASAADCGFRLKGSQALNEWTVMQFYK